MLKWIRWSGLIAFIVVVAGIAAFFLLLAAPLTKSALESLGTDANGAKVDVNSVGLSFHPLGFKIHGLQVTDAEAPMTNAVEFKTAVAALELGPLLGGRIIIRELGVDGLAFGTARKTSGAIAKKVEPAASKEPSAVSQLVESVELPDPKDILARESLRTDAAGEALRSSYAEHKADIEQRLGMVPNDAALAHYQDEIKALTHGKINSLEEFKQRKVQLDELKQRMKQDQAAVEAARAALASGKTDLATKLKELKAAPGQDLASIRDKYQLNADGAANMSALLFGDDAGKWAQQALYWYEKIKPYLASDNKTAAVKTEQKASPRSGRYVHFPTTNPWPDFLVRSTHMGATLAWGELQITGTDLTHQPAILGRPAQVVVNGANLARMDNLNLDLVLDHRFSPAVDTLTLQVKDWRPESMNLGKELQLTSALTQIQATAVVSNNLLDAQGNAEFRQAKFVSAGSSSVARELNNAVAAITEFNVDASAKGKITHPKVKLSSDLDKQLSHVFGQRLKAKQAEFEQQLNAELNKKLEQYAGEHAEALNQIAHSEGGVNAKLEQLKTLGSAELKDFAEQQKQEAKEKAEADAKAKAKDKLKKLF